MQNPFEVFFSIAAQDPGKRGEFDQWVLKTRFWVPAQQISDAAGAVPREIDLTKDTRIRLKAFSQGGQTVVPFFSALARFESWSTPDPQGRFAILDGKTFVSLLPPGAVALLNPGSEDYSKWFTSEELSGLLSLSRGK